jgi:hypothetical protein
MKSRRLSAGICQESNRSGSRQYNLVEYVCNRRRSERLFKRCENPALPSKEPLYSQAKRLEYDGDISGALGMFYRALARGERVDSCLKDIAGLLNMLGRTAEAVEFLESHRCRVVNGTGYENLLARLKTELQKESSGDLPRGITITVLDDSLGPVSMTLCDRLFPNPSKIKRILFTDRRGLVGAVHFATHSSARKALQVHKVCENKVAVAWSSLYVDARLRMLEQIEATRLKLQVVSHESIPSHLRTLGGPKLIPTYREDDEAIPPLPAAELERINLMAKAKAESTGVKMAARELPTETRVISPVSSGAYSLYTRSPLSSLTSISPTSLGAVSPAKYSERFAPFVTQVVHPNGFVGAALVVPFAEHQDSGEFSELIDGDQSTGDDTYRTPMKPRQNGGCQFLTPSPIIERSLFT